MGTLSARRVSQQEIRAALDRILASPDFETSERNRRFLRHVVEEALAGRAERIKAYSIATLVFGRSEDFDPMQDSIVRIEAGRLRRALDNYHLKHGDGSDVIITIPKGSYVPVFQQQAQALPPAPEPVAPGQKPLHEYGPRILVEPFEQEGDSGTHQQIGRTLTRQVISALTRFTELFVYGFDTSDRSARSGSGRETSEGLEIDYRLSGTVTISKHALIAEILMKRNEDGRFIWVQTLQREIEGSCDPSQVVSLCAEVAGQVASVLALRDGIMDSQARDSSGSGPRHFAGYQKLLDFHDYWRSLDPKRFEPLRRDLEATIDADPGFVAAPACLSMLYSNAARFSYDLGDDCPDPLERALDLARKAIRLAPSSSRAYHARAIAEWFMGRQVDSLQTLGAARALNPNDPELMAELGFRLASRKNWDAGIPLLEEAYARSPLLSGQFRMGLFLYHFAHGRHEQALEEIRAVEAPGIAHVQLAAAAALAALGRLAEARQRLALADQIAPGLATRMPQDVAFRQFHPDLTESMMRTLASLDPKWPNQANSSRLHRL